MQQFLQYLILTLPRKQNNKRETTKKNHINNNNLVSERVLTNFTRQIWSANNFFRYIYRYTYT